MVEDETFYRPEVFGVLGSEREAVSQAGGGDEAVAEGKLVGPKEIAGEKTDLAIERKTAK